jgi:hypothetical protein
MVLSQTVCNGYTLKRKYTDMVDASISLLRRPAMVYIRKFIKNLNQSSFWHAQLVVSVFPLHQAVGKIIFFFVPFLSQIHSFLVRPTKRLLLTR